MLLAFVFTNCEGGNSLSFDYPSIVSVNRYIAGDWEIINWINEDGAEEAGEGTIYKITNSVDPNDLQDYNGCIITTIENGQVGSTEQFRFEPILKGDLDGSNSERTAGVEIYNNSMHYVIAKISDTSMKWQEISFTDGKVNIHKKGMIFKKL